MWALFVSSLGDSLCRVHGGGLGVVSSYVIVSANLLNPKQMRRLPIVDVV